MAQPDAQSLANAVAVAGRLADAAATLTAPLFAAGAPAESKSADRFDPVTQADRDAEALMRALLAELRPEDGVEGEEMAPKPALGPWSWTLDPVDGTRAFIAGAPVWTTLIAASFEGVPVVGVIDQPVLGRRFLGAGGRAWEEGPAGVTALRVRPCARLVEAVVSTTDPFLFAAAEAAAFEQVRRAARLARYGCDAFAYAMVAAGRIDLVIESGLKRWDVAALVPVIEGAGGVLSDWRGRRAPAWAGGQVVAAGDARVREQAMVALKRAAA